eukprot:1160780-Pelagomonas_calceolata.AAC.6
MDVTESALSQLKAATQDASARIELLTPSLSARVGPFFCVAKSLVWAYPSREGSPSLVACHPSAGWPDWVPMTECCRRAKVQYASPEILHTSARVYAHTMICTTWKGASAFCSSGICHGDQTFVL